MGLLKEVLIEKRRRIKVPTDSAPSDGHVKEHQSIEKEDGEDLLALLKYIFSR